METSLLNIIVISKHLKEIKFTDLAPQALREYADAIEAGTATGGSGTYGGGGGGAATTNGGSATSGAGGDGWVRITVF